jgi:glycosyltransferase involved in cell wall biosynthesis
VIGDGDDRATLESRSRELMLGDECIKFHGRVDGSTLQAAYKSAKALVMPSAKEGFGIVFLEAMRHAVPCIGGAHGGTPEVFTNGVEGFLVDYGDTEALTSTLKTIYGSPLIVNDVGRAAYQRYLTDYQFSQFSSRWTIYLNTSSTR